MEEFIRKVAEMRHWQKVIGPGEELCELERQVDAMLEEFQQMKIEF